jgi:UDP-N-acetylglucosamine 2-epimerase (non-hydrolysing)/GDP/UDP-N,N'-diacetylbacillosamine 2-epimerase (hydrolysing)
MRTIGVVTGARSDYGGLLPILKRIVTDSELELLLFVTGMHLSPEFGLTVRVIEADGFHISERVDMLVASDTPQAISKSIGLGVLGFSQAYSRTCPDLLLVMGDRFETLAAVIAALPYTIPVAHISGGEITEGVIDDAIRHSITKMSHLHFVAMNEYRDRIIQMGEEPWRVTVTGEPGLDRLKGIPLFAPAELKKITGLSLSPAPLLVTFHPLTLEPGETEISILALLSALEELSMPVIFTYPNADTGGHIIIEQIEQFVQTHPNARVLVSLGAQGYASLMNYSAAMLGNSSSGIIEAATFDLPVVDIGDRQRGRVRGQNVVHAEADRESILRAARTALSPSFRRNLRSLKNPYGDGNAAQRIMEVLKTTPLGRDLLVKRFHNLGECQSTGGYSAKACNN